MAKWSKKLLGLAAIGSAAAGLVYYLKKSKKNEDDDFNDDFEDGLTADNIDEFILSF